jgi:hypothetical protein
MNRRDFVRSALAAVPFFTLLAKTSLATDAKAPAAGTKTDLVMVKETDPMPKSLQYCDDADKKKGKVCPMRKEPARAKQYCEGCQFYTASGSGVGKCQILQNQGVKAKGWCSTWAQKAT